jgi:hypothetical protein
MEYSITSQTHMTLTAEKTSQTQPHGGLPDGSIRAIDLLDNRLHQHLT